MINRFRIWLQIRKAKSNQKKLPTKPTEAPGLEYTDDIMNFVSEFVLKQGSKFWMAHVLYQVKSVRNDGKIILKVIAGKKGSTIVRAKS